MAMSEIPFFQIKNAKDKGEALPEGSAVDRRGLPTTDAAVALGDDGTANLLPVGGGFKGYGLVMLIEILTGSLVRSLLSTKQTPGWNPPEYGGFVCAIDIASFTDRDLFVTLVGDQVQVKVGTYRMRRKAPRLAAGIQATNQGGEEAEGLLTTVPSA